MPKIDKSKLHKKIRIQLWAYVAIFVVTLVLSSYHIVADHVVFYFPLGAFITGIIAGIILGRTKRVTWDKDGEKLISEMDKIGFGLVVVYLIFLYFRDSIIEHITHLHHIGAITMALTAGIMLGRVLRIRRMAKKIMFS